MVRTLKFLGAMLGALSIAAEMGWIKIYHPGMENFHQMLLKWLKLILYVLFP